MEFAQCSCNRGATFGKVREKTKGSRFYGTRCRSSTIHLLVTYRVGLRSVLDMGWTKVYDQRQIKALRGCRPQGGAMLKFLGGPNPSLRLLPFPPLTFPSPSLHLPLLPL